MKLPVVFIIFLISWATIFAQKNPFVNVENGQFVKKGQPYHYIGFNMWYAMHLGAGLNKGDQDRLERELDQLKELGIDNLRIMASSDGPSTEPWRVQPALQNSPGELDENLLKGLDFVLAEMGKRDMVAVLCLNNFFHWSGGMSQYVSWADGTPIPYPHGPGGDWTVFQNYASTFFSNKKAIRYNKQFVKQLLKRKNTINGVAYKNDPAIMAWQLANEPRGFVEEESYVEWVKKTSRFIRKKDKHHLISLGGEGSLTGKEGTAFEQIAQIPDIDYLTAHIWIENWGWYKPSNPDGTLRLGVAKVKNYFDKQLSIADSFQKPLVIEEFGMSRDQGDHSPDATTNYRDKYYEFLLQTFVDASKKNTLGGANIWSWAGEAQPPRPHEFWEKGDPLTGDPPHEKQGWYSIYAGDISTLELIKNYNQKIKKIGSQVIEK